MSGIVNTSTTAQRVLWRERFESRLSKQPDGCWIWTGTKIPRGYGLFYPAWRVHIYAHRFAWELAHDASIPSGLHILHTCDNPSCANPAHLVAGTHSDNMQDCVRKGRHKSSSVRGEARHNAKLTERKVRAIREQRAAGVGPTELARKYGVSKQTIKLIVARKSWNHVE